MPRKKAGTILLGGWIALGLGVALLVVAQIGSANLIGLPQGEEPVLSTANTSFSGPIEGPAKLVIPSLGINANVQHVGIDKNGNMDVPRGINKWKDVAWYELGPKPGEMGNAAISGHVDNALGMDAIFADIDKLKPGDMMEIEGENGQKLRFRVTHSGTYHYKDAPLDEIFGATNQRRMNLITCTGEWIQSERNYSHRLVVYTELVN